MSRKRKLLVTVVRILGLVLAAVGTVAVVAVVLDADDLSRLEH